MSDACWTAPCPFCRRAVRWTLPAPITVPLARFDHDAGVMVEEPPAPRVWAPVLTEATPDTRGQHPEHVCGQRLLCRRARAHRPIPRPVPTGTDQLVARITGLEARLARVDLDRAEAELRAAEARARAAETRAEREALALERAQTPPVPKDRASRDQTPRAPEPEIEPAPPPAPSTAPVAPRATSLLPPPPPTAAAPPTPLAPPPPVVEQAIPPPGPGAAEEDVLF